MAKHQHLNDPRIPATIIGGFLGSGKTTLLNRILQSDQNLRAAVLVNDFGSINIDSQLITSNDGKVMSLANGCICCNIADDLTGQIDEMLNQDNPPACLLIEASGVSDPGRIARTLNYRLFRDRVRINALINLIDADQFNETPEEFIDLAKWQLKQADIVVINKTDLCTKQQIAELKQQWIPENATVYETSFAQVPLSLLLDVDSQQSHEGHDCQQQGCSHDHNHDHSHDNHGDIFDSISWQCNQAINEDSIKAFIQQLPNTVYRAKGFFLLKDQPSKSLLLQKVGKRINWTVQDSSPEAGCTLVMIAQKSAVDFDTIKNQLTHIISSQ